MADTKKKTSSKKTSKRSGTATKKKGTDGSGSGRSRASGGSQEDAEDDQPEGDQDEQRDADGGGSDRESSARKLKPVQAARLATKQIRVLTGRTVDGVSGVERAGDGWHVLVEVVEIERVPAATDVIGVYEVVLDSDGDLDSYERVRRYVRGQAGDDS